MQKEHDTVQEALEAVEDTISHDTVAEAVDDIRDTVAEAVQAVIEDVSDVVVTGGCSVDAYHHSWTAISQEIHKSIPFISSHLPCPLLFLTPPQFLS